MAPPGPMLWRIPLQFFVVVVVAEIFDIIIQETHECLLVVENLNSTEEQRVKSDTSPTPLHLPHRFGDCHREQIVVDLTVPLPPQHCRALCLPLPWFGGCIKSRVNSVSSP